MIETTRKTTSINIWNSSPMLHKESIQMTRTKKRTTAKTAMKRVRGCVLFPVSFSITCLHPRLAREWQLILRHIPAGTSSGSRPRGGSHRDRGDALSCSHLAAVWSVGSCAVPHRRVMWCLSIGYVMLV